MNVKLVSLRALMCLMVLVMSMTGPIQAPVLSMPLSSPSPITPTIFNTVPAAVSPAASSVLTDTLTAEAPAKVGAVNQYTASPQVIGETDPTSTETAVYIVRLADAPLATYKGGLADLPATSPAVTGASRLNVRAAASVAYRSYLSDKQAQFLKDAQQTLDQPIDVLYQYDVVFNGLAVELTPRQAARLLKTSGVASIQRDYWRYPATSDSLDFLGVPDVWDGSGTGGLPGTKGDGIIVGVVDSGIWPEHPSFADDGSYPATPSKWDGACEQPEDATTGYSCNNKLIGIRYFLEGYVTSLGGYDGLFLSGRDDNGHGTHTASTAAGNEDVQASIYGINRGTISGVAPRAYVAAYKGLGPGGGTGSDLTAAINQAVADGVDVINYSVGSDTATDPWLDSDALSYLNAREAGVFVAVSAGNAGPGPATVGSPANAPWVTSVGASYFNRLYLSTITVTVSTGGVYTYYGATVTPGVTNFDLIDTRGITDTSGATNGSCDAAFPANTFNFNDTLLCDGGGGLGPIHGNLIQQSGGGAVILYNAEGRYDFNLSLHPIPTVIVLREVGEAIMALFDANPGATFKVTFTAGQPVYDPDPRIPTDTVTAFSSRGPNINESTGELINVLKPDVTAPGIHVLAGASPEYVEEYNGTYYRYGMQNQFFQVIQGTSMSSPHVAGLGALLKALHPEWSPAEMQSALMLTGLTSNQYEREASGDSAADPFDIGAGRVLIANAAQAAFVLDETTNGYLAANPSADGDPSALNLASLTEAECLGTCTFTRIITSTSNSSINWNAAGVSTGLGLTIEPSSFTLGAHASRVVTVTVDASSLDFGSWGFGEIRFNGSGQSLHFTVAARSVPGLAPSEVEIETRRNQGSYQIEGLESAGTGVLTFTTYSGVPQTLEGSAAQDPTGDDAYDDLDQVYVTTVDVPAGARGLEISIVDSTAEDLDMYVGFDADANGEPDITEELCASTSGSYTEYCSLPESGSSLDAGTYWILVQNWAGSGADTDTFALNWTMIEEDGGSGPIQVAAPGTVTAGTPYDLDLSWDLPDLQAGDIKTEVISLFCAGVALNEVKVTLNRLDDDVTKVAQTSDYVEPGDTVPYAITINPDPVAMTYNGGSATYRLTDTLPAGMSYVPGSASLAPTSINGNQLVWVIPVQEDRQYVMTTNMNDALCDTGFGGYINLANYGLLPRSNLSGDAIVHHVDEYFGGSDAFNFFGTDYDALYFTDNGYVVPADAAPTNSGANVAIPNAAAPNNFAAGLWRDFIVTYNATSRYGITIAGAGGNNLMIVEYDNISPTGNPATDSLDMNIVFSRQPSDGVGEYEVVFAYDNVALATPQTGTIGLENADGTDGVQYAFNDLTAGELEDLIICYNWTNQVKITYEATVNSGLTTSQKLTNSLQHFVNGGGVGETEAEITVSAVLLDIEAEGQTEVPAGPLTYTLTIANNGVGAAAGATAAADLPVGTTHRSGGSYNPVTGVVTWALPTIASAGSTDVQLVVSPTALMTLPKPDDPVFPAASAAGGFIPQIIGGGPARITDWPWQVALLDSGSLPDTYGAQFCAGALIAPDWVLTAAHCAVDRTPEDITVLAGTAVLTDSQATLANVAKIIVHEQYDPTIVESDYDIALLRLSEPLPLSDSIDTIRVATPADAAMYAPDLFANAIGWGKIGTNPNLYTAQLQRVTLQLQSNADCSAYLSDHFGVETPISDHMICAGFPEGGKGSCSGDSGGALVIPDGEGSWLVAGVTSWGATACNAPSSVYTRASQFVEWIERAMNRYTFETCTVTTGTGLTGGADTCSQPVVTEVTFPKKLQQETLWPATKTVRTFAHTNGLTATVTVPAEVVGTLDETIQLVYSPLDAPTHALATTQAVTDSLISAGHAFYLVATQEGAPLTDYAFSQPVTLTLSYKASVADEDSLALYRWNGTEWTQEGITTVNLNQTANRLKVTLTNPGEFALLQEGVISVYMPLVIKQ